MFVSIPSPAIGRDAALRRYLFSAKTVSSRARRLPDEGPRSCRFDHTFDERASIRSRRVVHRGSGRRLAQWEGDYSWLASTVACVTQSPTGRSLGALRRPRDDTPSFREILKDAKHVPAAAADRYRPSRTYMDGAARRTYHSHFALHVRF